MTVNGGALLLLALALPAGGLLLFGLAVPDAVGLGALVGWTLGFTDLLISGRLFARALLRGDATGAFRQIGIGLGVRLVLVVLVFFALRRVPAVDGTAFAISFVAAHLISIGGWAWKLADGRLFAAVADASAEEPAPPDQPATDDDGPPSEAG